MTLLPVLLPEGYNAKVSVGDHITAGQVLAEGQEKAQEVIVPLAHQLKLVPQKAIKFNEEFFNGNRVPKPYVDISLCVGCGICQNKCPTRPSRAIKVSP